MCLEKGTEPFNRGGLCDASGANLQTREVVGDEDPASFTIEPNKISCMGSVGGRGTGKRKIDRKALKRDGGFPGAMGAGRCLGLLGADASGTCIEDGVHVVETGNAFEIFVGIE